MDIFCSGFPVINGELSGYLGIKVTKHPPYFGRNIVIGDGEWNPEVTIDYAVIIGLPQFDYGCGVDRPLSTKSNIHNNTFRLVGIFYLQIKHPDFSLSVHSVR